MTNPVFCGLNEAMGRLGIICHPLRYNIMKTLYDSSGGIDEVADEYLRRTRWHINRLAAEIGVPRQSVSFHLTTLEENDLVASEIGIIKFPKEGGKGLAGRHYHISYIGIIAFESIRGAISELEKYLESEDGELKVNSKFYLID